MSEYAITPLLPPVEPLSIAASEENNPTTEDESSEKIVIGKLTQGTQLSAQEAGRAAIDSNIEKRVKDDSDFVKKVEEICLSEVKMEMVELMKKSTSINSECVKELDVSSIEEKSQTKEKHKRYIKSKFAPAGRAAIDHSIKEHFKYGGKVVKEVSANSETKVTKETVESLIKSKTRNNSDNLKEKDASILHDEQNKKKHKRYVKGKRIFSSFR